MMNECLHHRCKQKKYCTHHQNKGAVGFDFPYNDLPLKSFKTDGSNVSCKTFFILKVFLLSAAHTGFAIYYICLHCAYYLEISGFPTMMKLMDKSLFLMNESL